MTTTTHRGRAADGAGDRSTRSRSIRPRGVQRGSQTKEQARAHRDDGNEREKCWIDDARLLRELAKVQGDRRDVDDWFNAIDDAVRGREKVDPEWIYEALGIASKDRTRQHGSRIKNVMIELGYRHMAIRLPGRAKNLKGYQKRKGEAACE